MDDNTIRQKRAEIYQQLRDRTERHVLDMKAHLSLLDAAVKKYNTDESTDIGMAFITELNLITKLMSIPDCSTQYIQDGAELVKKILELSE